MNLIMEIIAQVKEIGGRLEVSGDKVRVITPAGSVLAPELKAAIRDHKPELLHHLDEIAALEAKARTTGKLTWEESGRLLDHYRVKQTPFEEEADILLLASTKRISRAWPKGFDLDDDPRWQQADKELHAAYWSCDPEKLRVILELREKLAMKLFEAHRKEAAA